MGSDGLSSLLATLASSQEPGGSPGLMPVLKLRSQACQACSTVAGSLLFGHALEHRLDHEGELVIVLVAVGLDRGDEGEEVEQRLLILGFAVLLEGLLAKEDGELAGHFRGLDVVQLLGADGLTQNLVVHQPSDPYGRPQLAAGW